jgi:hypothetical protein
MQIDKRAGKAVRQALAVIGLALVAAMPARAATVLLYIDSVLGTNYVTPALTAGSHTVTTATSWADFNTKLAGGSYQLVIALNQNNALGANLATLQNYINGGGRVIFTDWTQQSSFATALGGAYTGTTNQNSLNFLLPALSAGITNPQPLSNPGWGTYSMGESAAGGVSVCSFPNSNSCVVSANGGRTLLLGFLSDTPSAADGVRLWENLIGVALNGAGPVPSTLQPVPTLGQWSLLALALLLATFARLYLRRRG